MVADAVFTYLRLEGDGVAIEQRFLEVDRATLSVDRLAAGLARYPELYRLAGGDGEPLWRSRYPVFLPSTASSPGTGGQYWNAAARPPPPCCEVTPDSPARRR